MHVSKYRRTSRTSFKILFTKHFVPICNSLYKMTFCLFIIFVAVAMFRFLSLC